MIVVGQADGNGVLARGYTREGLRETPRMDDTVIT
jgi:hypothetical protein